MRRLPFVLVLLCTVPAAAQAALLQIDITYTNGQILSGPLSADLTELPESVLASFTLSGPLALAYDLEDVVQASLAFGDGAWSVGDLQSFTTTLLDTDSGGLAVTSLTYAYAPIDTPAVNGRLTANFPLDIQGTDVASGLPFHYQYDTSSQMVTEIPEPSTLMLGGIAILALVCCAKKRALFRRELLSGSLGPQGTLFEKRVSS